MTRILVVNASPNLEDSVSRKLTARYIDGLQASGADVDVRYRDVGETPPPHLDQATVGAFYTPADERTDEQRRRIAHSDDLVAEIQAADVIVIGSPMHNFGISSSLKAWIDHVTRVGVTFRYTENGPQGLLGGRKAVVVGASGGDYAEGSPTEHLNHQKPYLKTVLAFIGLDDVAFIDAPGTAKGGEGVDAAAAALDNLVADRWAFAREAA